MALTATLTSATASFSSANLCSLYYTVKLYDDQLGYLGDKFYNVTDANTAISVRAYVQQMLPTIEAQVGIPVLLPESLPLDVVEPTANTN